MAHENTKPDGPLLTKPCECETQLQRTDAISSIAQPVEAAEVRAITIQPNNVNNPRYDGRCVFFTAAEFLDKFEQYLQIEKRDLRDKERIGIIYECLQGEPKLWFRAFQYRFNSWKTFKRLFLNRFWGCLEQRTFMAKMMHGSYVQKGRKSRMSAYFIRFLINAQYLELPPTEDKVIRMMTKHFPSHVQDQLEYNQDIAAVYNTLVMMDLTENESPSSSQHDRSGEGKL